MDFSLVAAELPFGGGARTFPEGGLSLPQGFGVPAPGIGDAAPGPVTAFRSQGNQAGAAVPSTGAGSSGPAAALALVPTGTPPPAAAPRGASFAALELAFPSADLSFGRADTFFGSAAATVGGSGSDLGGSTIDLPGLAVREEGGGYRFTLGADVLFDFDKFQLRREAGPILQKLVTEVRSKTPSARWQVEGHTDAKGSDAYNDRLSDRRADSVRAWLTLAGGVPAGEISTLGFGEGRPVAPNSHPDGSGNPEGRQLNRRVEILVTPP